MLVQLGTSASATSPSTDFASTLEAAGLALPERGEVTTLQVNLGKRCNQACLHCHVEAGPKRSESMSLVHVEQILRLLEASPEVRVLDITGGAPELNPHFRQLVQGARALGLEVIDRCNLSIIFEPGMQGLAEFLAQHAVRVVASLPCYTADNVDAQRGQGAFAKSIDGLLLLNQLGYAQPGSELILDLVYNPGGAHLPPAQTQLEATYRQKLQADFGIQFTSLLTLTNLPVSRFAHALQREGKLESYMQLLIENFNPSTLDGLMCRTQLNVGWDGSIYDCDFNQMLDMPATSAREGSALNILDLACIADFGRATIATASHCFGCTAGAGSSCGGAIAASE